jgi:hypothetical protein
MILIIFLGGKNMPTWLVNSFRKGYELKDIGIIMECHKMWNEILKVKG